MYVRPVETEDRLPGGRIIIPEDARQKFASHQVQIVAVGEPEICEDETCSRQHGLHAGFHPTGEWFEEHYHGVPADLREGAWALVRPRSFTPVGHDGDKLYAVRQSDVLACFVET